MWVVLFVVALACEETRPKESSGGGVLGLSAETASQVLAVVGERKITLGDYAVMYDRMDEFERLRYQSEDRREDLLQEMIDLELLAREAERRGLDKDPEAQALLIQLLKEQALRELRESLPAPEDLPAAEVRAYFDAHREDFVQPERRRVAWIVLGDREASEQVLQQARGSDVGSWNQLARQWSKEPVQGAGDTSEPRPDLEVAGDQGFLERSGGAVEVGEPLLEALFAIDKDGAVHGKVVEHAGKFYILRRVARVGMRRPELSQVEGAVRNRLLEQRFEAARAAWLEQLKKQIPVQINDAALEQLRAGAQ